MMNEYCTKRCVLTWLVVVLMAGATWNPVSAQQNVYSIIDPTNFLNSFHKKFDKIDWSNPGAVFAKPPEIVVQTVPTVIAVEDNANHGRESFPPEASSSPTSLDNETMTVVQQNPPGLAVMPPMSHEPTFDEVPFRVPQSFTILMNFKNNGKTSFHIMDEAMVYFSDFDHCEHGQILDPSIGVCRDVFCVEGYTFTINGCVPNNNTDNGSNQEEEESHDAQLDLVMLRRMCRFEYGQEESADPACLASNSAANSNSFLDDLKKNFTDYFQIDPARIQNMQLINSTFVYELGNSSGYLSQLPFSQEATNGSVMVQKSEKLTVSFLLKDKASEASSESDTTLIFYYFVLLAIDRTYVTPDSTQLVLIDAKQSQAVNAGWCDEQGDSLVKFNDSFRVLASFESSKNPRYFVYVNATETLYSTGYFYLTVLYSPSKSNSTDPSIKNDNGDIKSPSILQTSRFKRATNLQFNTDSSSGNPTKSGFVQWYYDKQVVGDADYVEDAQDGKRYVVLSDITSLALDQNGKDPSSNASQVAKSMLYVCNRAPKIKESCLNFETVRIGLCELEQAKNRSYCSKILNRCFSIDEYVYDPILPNEYIRVCKYITVDEHRGELNNSAGAGVGENGSNATSVVNLYNKKVRESVDVAKQIPGWVSFFSIIVSLLAMAATLITYFLFAQLRNIPGWNIINLTLALCIAQASFLIGSLINAIPVWCLITSLTTHYAYLAAFFWMNVIAFDLFRNFRAKSSHLLLTNMSPKARLPSYAIYAWISPLVIVLIAATIDLTVKVPYSELVFKPCYAGYLEGCKESIDIPLHKVPDDPLNGTGIVFPPPPPLPSFHFGNTSLASAVNQTDLVVKCYPTALRVNRLMVLSATCWIKNGNANLIFFGAPIGVIIAANAVFYFFTVFNIRKKKAKQRKNDIRRFSRIKLPGDEDVKFYIQMAVIMGFTWITGFFLMSFPTELVDIKLAILYQVLIYVFILSNASIGVFIFFAFIFKKSVKNLYVGLVRRHLKRSISIQSAKALSPGSTSSTKSSISSTSTASTTRSILRNSGSSASSRESPRSVEAPRVRWSSESGTVVPESPPPSYATDFRI